MQASKPIGMNEQEIREFSFRKAIYGQLRDSGIDNKFERECSDAYAKLIGKDARGLFVPPDVMLSRTFNKTTGAGANLIATELRPDMFIDILRNMSVTAQAGAMMMPGLVGNIAIPRQTGAMTSYWFDSESAGITSASNPTVDQVPLSPKTLGAYGDISRSLLKQSTPGAEQLVRNDIAAVIALAIDLAALKGTASNGQPRGITQTSGINAANWTTANTPTWAELVAMETAVDLANALAGEFVYVMGASLVGKCKTTLKDSGVSGYLMESDRTVNGYRVINSNQLAAGEAIFGKFASLIIGMWGGLDLQVNPYIEALEKAGAVRVTALQDVDVAVRQPKEFTYNSNTPAS
jgi:HK97 family phage major capsid protein